MGCCIMKEKKEKKVKPNPPPPATMQEVAVVEEYSIQPCIKSHSRDGDYLAELISLEPRAVIYHNFLSQNECEHLIYLAKPNMKRSTVYDTVTGGSKVSSNRTSFGAYLKRGLDETVGAIEKRIADCTSVPVEHGEGGLQVLRYEVGQKIVPHYDHLPDDYNIENGGPRMATVLMYLSDVEEGGETVFPEAKGNNISSKKGLSVKPKMGDALLFWSLTPDGTPDPSSLHGGSPVIKGNKWACTKFIRVNPYNLQA